MTRNINKLLIILAVLVGLPFYLVLLDNRPGDAAPKPIHMAQLRALAASLPGPAPTSVEVEAVAFRYVISDLVAAGSGLKLKRTGVFAWRLPVPGRRPIVIGSGLTPKYAKSLAMRRYNPQSQARIEAALKRSGMILFTHEHNYSMGGFVAMLAKAATPAEQQSLLAKAKFNPSQLPPSREAAALPWPKNLGPKPSLDGRNPQAVAPGVVVIPAPSHSLGSQIIFVRLADGQELLFAGDVATMNSNWRELRARSWILGQYFSDENRPEVYSWLLTIRQLAREAPQMMVIPGHDLDWLTSSKVKRVIAQEFTPDPTR